MTLNGIVTILYVFDIQIYTVIDNSWGIGELICKNGDSFELNSGCGRQFSKPSELAFVQFLNSYRVSLISRISVLRDTKSSS
jgi:hypothetical protein